MGIMRHVWIKEDDSHGEAATEALPNPSFATHRNRRHVSIAGLSYSILFYEFHLQEVDFSRKQKRISFALWCGAAPPTRQPVTTCRRVLILNFATILV